MSTPEWRKKHRKELAASHKKWQEENPVKVREYSRHWYHSEVPASKGRVLVLALTGERVTKGQKRRYTRKPPKRKPLPIGSGSTSQRYRTIEPLLTETEKKFFRKKPTLAALANLESVVKARKKN